MVKACSVDRHLQDKEQIKTPFQQYFAPNRPELDDSVFRHDFFGREANRNDVANDDERRITDLFTMLRDGARVDSLYRTL
jgi:hypothetical protein